MSLNADGIYYLGLNNIQLNIYYHHLKEIKESTFPVHISSRTSMDRKSKGPAASPVLQRTR